MVTIMFPKVLNDVRDAIARMNLNANSALNEGRVNSLLDERDIIAHLIEQSLPVEDAPRERHWYDMKVTDGDSWYPVNIKTTSGYHKKSSDNAGSKQGMLYAFTDVDVTSSEFLSTRMSTRFFHETLINQKADVNRDYFYLVVNKNDTSEVLLTGMKNLILSKSASARHNLPFQVHWGENHIPTQRSFDEAYSHVVGQYQRSVRELINEFQVLVDAEI